MITTLTALHDTLDSQVAELTRLIHQTERQIQDVHITSRPSFALDMRNLPPSASAHQTVAQARTEQAADALAHAISETLAAIAAALAACPVLAESNTLPAVIVKVTNFGTREHPTIRGRLFADPGQGVDLLDRNLYTTRKSIPLAGARLRFATIALALIAPGEAHPCPQMAPDLPQWSVGLRQDDRPIQIVAAKSPETALALAGGLCNHALLNADADLAIHQITPNPNELRDRLLYRLEFPPTTGRIPHEVPHVSHPRPV